MNELEQRADEYKESKRHRCFRANVGTVQIDYEKYLDNLKQAYIAGATEETKLLVEENRKAREIIKTSLGLLSLFSSSNGSVENFINKAEQFLGEGKWQNQILNTLKDTLKEQT